MQQTEHYQLSLWNQDDRILMETFNGNNEKLDAALHETTQQLTESTAQLSAAVAKCGNCQVQFQTYTGKGSGSNSFTFAHKPLLVVFGDDAFFFAVQGQRYATSRAGGTGSDLASVSWSGNRVAWTASTAMYQCNTSGKTYSMVVLLDVTN